MHGAVLLPFLSQTRRPRGSGEWASENAVTLIVTLAATRSITLAARQAGMSRQSAYALKERDSAFAYAWGCGNAGISAARREFVQG